MRLQITITELDRARWDLLQSVVRTEYEIPEKATRVCLTFSYQGEERHAEMPMGAALGLLMGLGTVGVGQAIQGAAEDISRRLEEARNAADPKRAAERAEGHPGHGVVVSETPSVFPDAPPVRTFECGCQEYGPYSSGEEADK